MYAARRRSLVTMSVCFRMQDRRQHKIAGRKAIAIEKGFVTHGFGEARQALCTNSTVPGRRSFAHSSCA